MLCIEREYLCCVATLHGLHVLISRQTEDGLLEILMTGLLHSSQRRTQDAEARRTTGLGGTSTSTSTGSSRGSLGSSSSLSSLSCLIYHYVTSTCCEQTL